MSTVQPSKVIQKPESLPALPYLKGSKSFNLAVGILQLRKELNEEDRRKLCEKYKVKRTTLSSVLSDLRKAGLYIDAYSRGEIITPYTLKAQKQPQGYLKEDKESKGIFAQGQRVTLQHQTEDVILKHESRLVDLESEIIQINQRQDQMIQRVNQLTRAINNLLNVLIETRVIEIKSP